MVICYVFFLYQFKIVEFGKIINYVIFKLGFILYLELCSYLVVSLVVNSLSQLLIVFYQLGVELICFCFLLYYLWRRLRGKEGILIFDKNVFL